MRTPNDNQIEALEKLKKIFPGIDVKWNDETGTPARIRGLLSGPIEGTPEVISRRFFQDNKALFGLEDPIEELQLKNINVDVIGNQHIRFQQNYHNIPVFGHQVIVHISIDNAINGIDANLVYIKNFPINVIISSDDARKIAMNDADYKKVDKKLLPELKIFVNDDMPSLAWMVIVPGIDDELHEAPEPAIWAYFINALNGEILWRYNTLRSHGPTTASARGRYAGIVNIPTFHYHQTRHYYLMAKNTRWGAEIYVYDAINGDFIDYVVRDRDNSWNASYHPELIDCMYYTCYVLDYFWNKFQRSSYDNASGNVKICAHYQVNFNNARWDGTNKIILIGDGDGSLLYPLCDLDIIAHEFTHGVSQHEVDFIYKDDSGAIDESFSDLFSCLISRNWFVGQNIWVNQTSPALRNIKDPTNSVSQLVNHTNNKYIGSRDQGGVHINSGILSFAAYLISIGGTHNGINVCIGLGRDILEKLLYQSYHHLLPNSKFADMRQAMLDSLDDLYGTSEHHDLWYATINNAYAAVGIGRVMNCPNPSVIDEKT